MTETERIALLGVTTGLFVMLGVIVFSIDILKDYEWLFLIGLAMYAIGKIVFLFSRSGHD